MQVGDLNKRLSILRNTKQRNALNEQTNQWSVLRTVWGNVHFVSDGEKFRAGTVSRKLAIRVTIRKPNGFDVLPSDRVQVGSTVYNIGGVKPVDRERFIEITADYQ